MTETLRLVRVFLASPGDLPDERRLASEAVDEINKGIAPFLGFRVELKGWEDTLPGTGRPQAIINQELDLCELFLGMMWKKWGTPPSTQGPYTSGFEEEFKRSYSRRKKTGQPEIAMFFKEVDKEFLDDPGDDLKRVIEFRNGLISEKVIFFNEFQDPNDLQRCVREKITQYLINLEKSEKENQDEESAKSKKSEKVSEESPNLEPLNSPFSVEGHGFLKNFLEKTEAEDSAEGITPLEVARFRLLSSAISKSGNDEPYLGVHDANIIYLNRNLKYGIREISKLIDCGLKNFGQEIVPLWHWYNIYKETSEVGENFLPFISFYDEGLSVGALEAMTLIGLTLPNEEELNRNSFIEGWLSEDNQNNIKLAALRYLKHHGKDEDLQLIQSELDQANPKTARNSLEAIVKIQLRYNKSEAIKTAYANQFESFDEALLEEVLSVSSNLDEATLKLGLKHRNNRIRLESFRRLKKRKKISTDELNELKSDSFGQIRKEVVEFLLSNNQTLKDKDVKNILIKPQRGGGFGGLFAPEKIDEEGQSCYDEYLFSKYSNMLENELLAIIILDRIWNDIPYFALCSRYFINHSEKLRENIDDKFKQRFEYYIERLKDIGASDETIKTSRSIEDSVRMRLTRKGLDVLCKKRESKDLNRIRENMRSGYVKSSVDEIEYMRKMGEWEDITFIVQAEKYYRARTSLLTFSIDTDWYRSVAEVIYSIGKDHFEDLLNLEMPHLVLVELIKKCSSSKFSEISDQTLLSLLNSKDDTVRKFASLKSIQSYKKSKLKSLLNRYIEGKEDRYYNVIYWLDFGIAMPKKITNRANNILFRDG
jgi:hypothetical protein